MFSVTSRQEESQLEPDTLGKPTREPAVGAKTSGLSRPKRIQQLTPPGGGIPHRDTSGMGSPLLRIGVLFTQHGRRVCAAQSFEDGYPDQICNREWKRERERDNQRGTADSCKAVPQLPLRAWHRQRLPQALGSCFSGAVVATQACCPFFGPLPTVPAQSVKGGHVPQPPWGLHAPHVRKRRRWLQVAKLVAL